MVYPGSGTGGWEAALVNTLSPGDTVLAFDTGHFATSWREMAGKLGLVVDFVPADWRHGVDPGVVAQKLAADTARACRRCSPATPATLRRPGRLCARGDWMWCAWPRAGIPGR